MSVHSVNHHQAAISPVPPAATAPAKTGSANTFGQVFGTYLPSSPVQPTASTTPAASETGFAALFSNYNPEATATASELSSTGSSTAAPFTAAYEFGATVTSPVGTQTALNPMELATPSTAAEVAQLLGGTVVASTLSGGFGTSVPTLEISVPGSNNEINAGEAANLFSQYGTAQGSQAWVTIDQDLGIG